MRRQYTTINMGARATIEASLTGFTNNVLSSMKETTVHSAEIQKSVCLESPSSPGDGLSDQEEEPIVEIIAED